VVGRKGKCLIKLEFIFVRGKHSGDLFQNNIDAVKITEVVELDL
jgi:hypothetical protein